ncbi:MAG: hypothetical protein CMI52_05200 [Parcubacteria group bacterium]|mgnify:CR=1 FL=1|nr:hypothetical protein [Parcubacteria group bacterium]
MIIQPVILAAGKGSRMDSEIPKVLLQIDKKPIIQHLLDSLSSCDTTTKPIIVVGDNKKHITQALSSDITYATQQTPLGTGHALQCALPNITAPYVLVCYGDHPFFTTHSLNKFCNAAKQNQTIAIGTVTVPHFKQWYNTFKHWGRIIRHDKAITNIIEYKDANPTIKNITEVNASPYLFNTKWLRNNIHELTNHNAQSEFYITDLIGIAVNQEKTIQTIPIPPHQAIGINTKQQLKFAQNRSKNTQIHA